MPDHPERYHTMESVGNINDRISCVKCGEQFTLRQLIDGADKCYTNLDVVIGKTPCCGATQEVWLRTGLASRGYVYAAGQAHFADMEQYDAPGMVVKYDRESVLIRFGLKRKVIKRK